MKHDACGRQRRAERREFAVVVDHCFWSWMGKSRRAGTGKLGVESLSAWQRTAVRFVSWIGEWVEIAGDDFGFESFDELIHASRDAPARVAVGDFLGK